MAMRDLKKLQKEADALPPEEQLQLARYLLHRARKHALKPTGDLSEFRGSIKLSMDPLAFQQAIRAEWP